MLKNVDDCSCFEAYEACRRTRGCPMDDTCEKQEVEMNRCAGSCKSVGPGEPTADPTTKEEEGKSEGGG